METLHRSKLGTACILPLLLAIFIISPSAAEADAPDVVRIGLVKSIFRDVPTPVVKMLMIPFGSMMYNETGLRGKMVTIKDALELGDQIEDGKLHLGVFHGFEFAWAQQKHPQLKPLMIAVNRRRWLTANLVTRKDSTITTFADLRGRAVSIPRRSRAHCHLYLEHRCGKCGDNPDTFFSKIVKHGNVEAALDDIVRGKVKGIVVDGVSLKSYELVKPGCFNRLKVIETSPSFPAAVIAYRHGFLDSKILEKFRQGMLNANKNPKSRDLMSLWQLTAFEPVPDKYQQMVESIRESFPLPAALVNMVEPTITMGE